MLAAVLTVLIGVCGFAFIGWHNTTSTISLTAQFDNTSGLYENNVVSVLGMPVGKVTKITPKSTYVEVEFNVDKHVPLPADVRAVTISTSILTDRQIELTPPYRDGPRLKNRDTIGLNRTKTPVEFDQVLSVVDKLATTMRGDGRGGGPVAEVIDAGAAITTGNGKNIKAALDELAKALQLSSNQGADTREQTTSIIKNTASLLEAATRDDDKLRRFSTTIHQFSQLLADEDFGSGTTGKKLNQVIEQAGSLLNANRDNIKQGLANGDKALQAVYDRQREVAELFDVLPLMLDNLYNIVDRTNGAFRAHFDIDRLVFDSQYSKEVCNLLGLRQLGCSTGTLQDYGPDFGLTYVLDGLAAMGQK